MQLFFKFFAVEIYRVLPGVKMESNRLHKSALSQECSKTATKLNSKAKHKKGVAFAPSMLIVQKETSYMYSKRTSILEDLPIERQEELRISHARHEMAKQDLLDFCRRNNISYKLLSDYELVPKHLNGHSLVVTLGGDGTFIKTASHLLDQTIIGVNTDPKNSVGGLTSVTGKHMLPVIRNHFNKKGRYELWPRLTATVNGKKTCLHAINEVVIGSPLLHQTSHLKVHIGKRIGFAHGNGLLIATAKGSTAFHKSAGGKSFTKQRLGYSFLMPHRLSNGLRKFGSLSLKERVLIVPLRQDYELMFDSKVAGVVPLKQTDVVEVFADWQHPLCVLVG